MLLAAVIPAVVTAQPTDTSDTEDVFELSPFVVDTSEDVGYLATNAVSGTSLNTAIRDLPMPIEVVSAEFLEDTAAIDFEDIFQYTSGVFTSQFVEASSVSRSGSNTPGANQSFSQDRSPSSASGVGGRYSTGIIIRGFNTPFQNRDGFRFGGTIAPHGVNFGGNADSLNIERVEVVKGPNSLLYGIGVLSGIANIVPKRPLHDPRTTLGLSVATDDKYRGTLDTTGPLAKDLFGGRLAYRFATAHEDNGDWTDFRTTEKAYYVFQLDYQRPKLDLFLEYQHSDQSIEGIGARNLFDNAYPAVDVTFRNAFGEHFNWVTDTDIDGVDGLGAGLPESYRLTGPDTYHDRVENALLANLDYAVMENLTLSAGAYVSEAEEEEFDLNLSTLTNEEMSFSLTSLDSSLESRRRDLEAGRDIDVEAFEQLDGFFNNVVWSRRVPDELLPDSAIVNRTDRRVMRYWWTRNPREIETQQFRIRAVYTFETPFFVGDTPAQHTLLAGRHDIRDEASYPLGEESINTQFSEEATEPGVVPQISDNDPLLFRSIFDVSPIRYNGELLAQPGDRFVQTTQWFTGHYGIYQGKFWDDRITLIAGIRHDRYQSRIREYDRGDKVLLNEDYLQTGEDANWVRILPTGIAVNPENETFGFLEGTTRYGPDPDKASKVTTGTGAISWRVHDAFSIYALMAEGVTPNTGLRDGWGDEIDSERSLSKEIGIKFDLLDRRISGSVSFYEIERENAVWRYDRAPNPLRWIGSPFPEGSEGNPERTFNPEYILLPKDDSNHQAIAYGIDTSYFPTEIDGTAVRVGSYTLYDEDGRPVRDPQTNSRVTVQPEGLEAGPFDFFVNSSNPQNFVYLTYEDLDKPAIFVEDSAQRRPIASGQTWRYYLEQAFADVQKTRAPFPLNGNANNIFPIYYGGVGGPDVGVNASNLLGAYVTYTDKATGMDLNLILTPIDNWQLIFNYSQVEREAVSPFQMASTVDRGTGVGFGTEYDRWVREFGRAAFGLEEHDDDGDGVVDRVTRDGEPVGLGDVDAAGMVSGLEGTSLYFGSEVSASFWSKYTFTDGPFDNLRLGFGAIYTGPAATSINIGSDQYSSNRFRTPDTEERWNFNALIGYSFEWREIKWSLNLNISNILDDTEGVSTVSYINDEELKRRTRTFYAPRSFRLSLRMDF